MDMKEKAISHEASGAGSTAVPAGNLSEMRSMGKRLLEVGSKAIDSALSENSTDFLRSLEQQGGE